MLTNGIERERDPREREDMERVASLHLLLLLFCFSYLIFSSHAIPSTRSQRMVKKGFPPSSGTTQVSKRGNRFEEIEFRGFGRMDLEIEDYPGSGANDRHTPKPPERS
ncbi:uncharacterized protein LOC109718120 isoform X2 [Ananas comosus]|uniref:Uncharacterized protein LOC109718120 isoform X2 n=1 Tax=Ananas comosus TaxID=4615 RepID=A0A199VZA8_ANACO|nr:uncharacterized protein LOC109718120 isoform X2 [Ananas comosus]OAY82557.1 hypothetical protein ACMD2_14219 [Ananas comosus]OAY84844.1 hypothetical protein ACMD2_10177 [Ananas comosus]